MLKFQREAHASKNRVRSGGMGKQKFKKFGPGSPPPFCRVAGRRIYKSVLARHPGQLEVGTGAQPDIEVVTKCLAES